MSMALYCLPTDILTDTATITVTAGVEDSAYPRTNLQDRKAHTVSKGTGTSITFRSTFGVSKTLRAVVFINTSATAIQLTNGAGLNQAISIPATPADGLRIDPWIDLRLLANTASTTWDVALTGATGVGIGELLLVETLREIPILWELEEPEAHAGIQHHTSYGVRLKYGMGVRQRGKSGRLILETFRPNMLVLQRATRGALKEFLLIVDPAENDALYGDLLTDSRTVVRKNPNVSAQEFQFLEAQKGLL